MEQTTHTCPGGQCQGVQVLPRPRFDFTRLAARSAQREKLAMRETQFLHGE